LLERLPSFFDRFGVQVSSDDLSKQVQERLTGFLASSVESINAFLENLVQKGPSVLLSGATNIISTTLQIFLILLASAYFLYDYPKFVESFRLVVPVRWRGVYSDLSRKADMAVGGYLRGQLLITMVLGVFIFIGLSIIGVPLALAISFLAALFNLVPYLGPIIGVIPAVLLGFTVSPWTALWAVLVFILANQIEGNFLAPFILSKSTNLHPVTVLLAILVGAGLFGLLGALLAVPVVALIKVVLDEYLFDRPPYQEPIAKPASSVHSPYQEELSQSANETKTTEPDAG
jgi:predicted PurR-regulated permease PerM